MKSRQRILCAIAVAATVMTGALTGCSTSVDSAQAPSSSAVDAGSQSTMTKPSTPITTPESAPAASGDLVGDFCKASKAAAAAKAKTVGEDLIAVKAQAAAARAMLPIDGVSKEIAAGAEVLVKSADETASILAQFPSASLVSDVGADPRFTQSEAVRAVATDPNYQAFIAWTIQTCGLG